MGSIVFFGVVLLLGGWAIVLISRVQGPGATTPSRLPKLMDPAQAFLEALPWLAVTIGGIGVGMALREIGDGVRPPEWSGLAAGITAICAGLLAVARSVRRSAVAIIEAIESARAPAATPASNGAPPPVPARPAESVRSAPRPSRRES